MYGLEIVCVIGYLSCSEHSLGVVLGVLGGREGSVLPRVKYEKLYMLAPPSRDERVHTSEKAQKIKELLYKLTINGYCQRWNSVTLFLSCTKKKL